MRGLPVPRAVGAPARAPVPPARRAAIRRRLLAWWARGRRDLPWRAPGAKDPYRVWLSEVMLQQTRVEVVVPYYRRFLARFPTLKTLGAARDEEVFAAWAGLGYYARCRNLLAAARTALRDQGGLPASLEGLRALPGVGPYTAGAVASIAFGIPAAAVDGNAARVLSRLFALRGDPARGRGNARLWGIARALVGEPDKGARPPPERASPGDFNQALIELGATVCRRNPACGRCPLSGLCAARAAGLARVLPRPRGRRERGELLLACAFLERGGEVLLARRSGRGLFTGLFCFPYVEVSPGGDPRRALLKGLARAGLSVRVGPEGGSALRVLTHRDLWMVAFHCRLVGRPRDGEGRPEFRWVARSRLLLAGLPAAMEALLPALLSGREAVFPRPSPGATVRGAPPARRALGAAPSRAERRTALTREGRNV